MLLRTTAPNYEPAGDRRMVGEAYIEALKGAPDAPALRALHVKFVDGAHTRWHAHTGEQILLVVEGKGFVEFRGGQIVEIHQSDRVFIPRFIWHRHGAIKGEDMVHLAISTGDTKWE